MQGLFRGKILKSVRWQNVFFIIILLSVSFYYNYQEIVFKRPQSIHSWRQADCASIALNYYKNGMRFFKPEVHNFTSDNQASGYSAPSEMPVLYYISAAFYKIFGFNEFILRLINTMIFLTGLFYLFRLFRLVLKNFVWAFILAALFFTSPVLIYYGNNFLTEVSALSFVIIAWYYFMLYQQKNKEKLLWLSALFFVLAGWLKVTALLSFIALFGMFLVQILFQGKFKSFKWPEKGIRTWLYFVSVIVISGMWSVFAILYNHKHDCTYFSTIIFPIWNMSMDQIDHTMDIVRYLWLDQYFGKPVLVFFLIGLGASFIFWNKTKMKWRLLVLLLFLGFVAYLLLWYRQLQDHDYYIVVLYIVPVIILINIFSLLRDQLPKVFHSKIFYAIASLFLIYNILYAKKETDKRYNPKLQDVNKHYGLNDIAPYLNKIGIGQEDTVICVPDPSHNSLYLMDRRGWTTHTDIRLGREDPVRYNQDSIGVMNSIQKGARYMFIIGESTLFERDYLQSFATHLTGQFKNILIFDLRDTIKNYTLPKLTLKRAFACNAEKLSPDSLFFLDKDGGALFKDAKNRSNAKSRSGKNSVVLASQAKFGMTIKIDSVGYNDYFMASVFKDKVNSEGIIVASGTKSDGFYKARNNYISNENGWHKIALDFFVPKTVKSTSITFYLYNPGNDTVFFDDLKIEWYTYISMLNNSE